MEKMFLKYMRAGYGALALGTTEYYRCLETLRGILKDTDRDFYVWDARGKLVKEAENDRTEEDVPHLEDLLEAIINKATVNLGAKAVWVISDADICFGDDPEAEVVALFRTALRECSRAGHTMILLGTTDKYPDVIASMLTVMEFERPKEEEIEGLAEAFFKPYRDKFAYDPLALAQAAAGMTASEIEDAFALATVSAKDGQIDAHIVRNEKIKAVSNTGFLRYIQTDVQAQDIGGLDNLVEYIQKRKGMFTKEAKSFGCPAPKGICLLGPAGTGKSLTAKAVSSILDMPLVVMDIGAMFGSLVGESEKNVRQAIGILSAIGRVVVFIDEIDKALAGTAGGAKSDGGTGARVLGSLLTWMSDNETGVYIVATCNSVENLPPELLRKGRFDELFYCDLPDTSARKEIFGIHLKKRNREAENFDTQKLAELSEGYSGAEIEQVVIEALVDAFTEGTDLETAHIKHTVKNTTPLSKLDSSQIDRLRAWGVSRCRSAASTPIKQKEPRKLEV